MMTLTYILSITITGILIGITAFVYSQILTQPGEIFAGLYRRLDNFFNTDERSCKGLGLHPVFKMIMACEKCVAGQMAFWFYIAFNYKEYLTGDLLNLIPHILLIGISIFTAITIKIIYTKYEF